MKKSFKRNVSVALLAPAVFGFTTSAIAGQLASPYMTATRYNANRQVTGIILPSPDGSADYQATRKTYDNHGWLIREEKGYLTQFPDESVDPQVWGGFSIQLTSVFTYDALGRKVSDAVMGTDGVVMSFSQTAYNDYDQVVCSTSRMNKSLIASLQTVYTNVPTDACAPGAEGADGPDRIAYFEYDGFGQLKLEKHGYRTPIEVAARTNTYDGWGRLTDVADANGNLTHLAYDTRSRVSNMFFPDPVTKQQSNPNDYETYGYDANSNRNSLRKRDNNTIVYHYDALNRLSDESYPVGTIASVFYKYDLQNHQTFAGNSAGTSGVTTTFDGFGNVSTSSTNLSGSARTLSYHWDAENHKTWLQHPDGTVFTYLYDGLGHPNTIKENGSTTLITFGYDTYDRPKTITRGASVSSSRFDYDNSSRISVVTHDLAGTGYDDVRTYGYNAARQVTSRTLSSNLFAFSQATTVNTTYMVNNLNQYTSLAASTTVVPAYDANANMKSDGPTTYGYDVVNRLVSATGAKVVNLAYDPKGRLFQTSGGASGVTQFLFDGDALVAEYGSTGNLLRRYVHGAGTDSPMVAYEGASVGATNRRYLFADHQGSITAVADTAGNGLQSLSYSVYGVPSTGNGSPATGSRFQYTGQLALPDLGLYYYKARIYNQTLGRFMQTDPIGYKDDADLYSYSSEDPVNRSDPTGLYGQGSGWDDHDADWKRFDAAQSRAATSLEQAAAQIKSALKEGGTALKDVSGTFEKVYGNGSATPENLQKVASSMEQAASVLRDHTTAMANADFSNASPGMAQAEIGRNTVTVFFMGHNGKGSDLEHPSWKNPATAAYSIGHEAGHSAGLRHDPIGKVMPYIAGPEESRALFDSLRKSSSPLMLTNPDAMMQFAKEAP